MRKVLHIGWLLLILCRTTASAQSDTLTLSRTEFLSIVRKFHPLAFRYQLQNNIAQAEIRRARGAFDPVADAKTGEKTLDNVQYYQSTDLGLGIPTWYGIELNGRYSYNEGQRLDNSTTSGGLYQFGLTLPVAKNLLYDRRRAILDQAKAGAQMTRAEQLMLTNELMLDAENAYWEWARNYEGYLLQRQTVIVSRDRLVWIRKAYNYGERPAIDTTEAWSQLQSFEQQEQDAMLKFVKAAQELQLYLWTEGGRPYEPSQWLIPAESLRRPADEDTRYLALIEQLENRQVHQYAGVVYYQQKGRVLESERRYKFQSLLPKLDFTYNFLNKEKYGPEMLPLFQNNYQYAVKFEMPLFLRTARADYSIARIKLQQNKLDLDYKAQEVRTKINMYRNEAVSYHQQINITRQNIENYRKLLRAEETRYTNGESSLFLINSRELKLLEAEQKLLELKLKFRKSYNQLHWIDQNYIE